MSHFDAYTVFHITHKRAMHFNGISIDRSATTNDEYCVCINSRRHVRHTTSGRTFPVELGFEKVRVRRSFSVQGAAFDKETFLLHTYINLRFCLLD